ncbi:MAG: FtsW/RodA/SpoVE family cell cycle protein, partial [Paenibacillaceae bacterium]
MNPPQRGTPDFFLLFLTFALIGFGLVMVFSASYSITFQDDPLSYTKRQALWAIIGIFVMFITMNTSYYKVKKLFVPFFLFVLFLLVLVLMIGEVRNGAKSWFNIGPFGGQPTEFAKIGIILYLSVMIGRKGEKLKDFKTGLLPLLIMVGLVGLLIMLQPDLGSMVILMITASLVIIVGGARKKHIFWLVSIATSIFFTAILVEMWTADITNRPSYRLRRLTSYMNPWEDPLDSGLQSIQSLYALGHGGLTGAG